MIRRWLKRRLVAWERKHPEEAKEATIKLLEGWLGRPLDEHAKQIIRNANIDYDEERP